jgi:ABC-2 type transport system ATP-binding protein
MISVSNLVKKYGDFVAVDNISFDISKGEIVGLLGPNGAGKTTTMKVLTGYFPPTFGKVIIDGIDLLKDPIAVKKKIGYLPENAPLYHEMNVLEYLSFAARMQNVPKTKIKSQIKKVVKECGLSEKIYQDIGKLSKGYRQRVGLAQSLIADPEILILDEPTVGLDPNQIIEIRNLIKHIGERKTIILSSHILAEVEATCDRVLIINKGKIIAKDSPLDLRAKSRGKVNIIVKIESKNKKEAQTVLEKIEGVDNVKYDEKTSQENTLDVFEIETEGKDDIRKNIIHTLLDNDFDLLEIYKKDLKLEDIFAKLTK